MFYLNPVEGQDCFFGLRGRDAEVKILGARSLQSIRVGFGLTAQITYYRHSYGMATSVSDFILLTVESLSLHAISNHSLVIFVPFVPLLPIFFISLIVYCFLNRLLIFLRRVPGPSLLTRPHMMHRSVSLDTGARPERIDSSCVNFSVKEVVQLIDTLVMHRLYRLLEGSYIRLTGFPLITERPAGQVKQTHILLHVDMLVPLGYVALQLGATLDHASPNGYYYNIMMKLSVPKEKTRPNKSANNIRSHISGDSKAKTMNAQQLNANMRNMFHLQDIGNSNILTEGLDIFDSHTNKDFSDIESLVPAVDHKNHSDLISKQQLDIQRLQKYYDLYIQQCFLLDLDYSEDNLEIVHQLVKEMKEKIESQTSIINRYQYHKEIQYKTIMSLEQKNQQMEKEKSDIQGSTPEQLDKDILASSQNQYDSNQSFQEKVDKDIIKSLEQENNCCQSQSVQDLLKEIHSLQVYQEEHDILKEQYNQHTSQFNRWKEEKQNNIMDLRQQLISKDNQTAEQQCTIQKLQRKIHDIGKQSNSYQSQIGKQEIQLQELQDTIKVQAEQSEQRDNQQKEANQQLEDKQAQMQAMRGELSGREEMINQMEKQIQMIQKKILQLSQQKHSQKEEEQRLREDLEQSVVVINRMGLQLEIARKERQEVIKESQDRNLQQKQDSLDQEGQLRKQIEGMQTLKEGYQLGSKNLKERLSMKDKQINEQMQLVEELQKEKEILQRQVIDMKINITQIFELVFQEANQNTIMKVQQLIN